MDKNTKRRFASESRLFWTRAEPQLPTTPSIEEIGLAIELIQRLEDNNDWAQNYLRRHKNRLAHDLDLVSSQLSANSKVLDVGCSPPVLLTAMSRTGFESFGIDIEPSRFCKTIEEVGLNVEAVNVEETVLPYSDNFFDGIIFNEMFEHLRINPIFTLGEILRVLKEDGRLFLSTPNLRSIYGYANLILKDKSASCCDSIYEEYEKLETLGHMGHVREYTSGEVREFLRKIGFEIEGVLMRGMNGPRWIKPIFLGLPKLRPFFSIVARKPSLKAGPG